MNTFNEISITLKKKTHIILNDTGKLDKVIKLPYNIV